MHYANFFNFVTWIEYLWLYFVYWSMVGSELRTSLVDFFCFQRFFRTNLAHRQLLERHTTPPRTLSISGLKSWVLKSTEPFQRYLLTCLANSAFLGRFFFALGSSNFWRGSVNFKITNSRHIRDIWFISKMLISRLEILVHL